MKSMTGITGGTVILPPAAPETRPASPAPSVAGSGSPAGAAVHPTAQAPDSGSPLPPTRAEMEAVVADLRESLARLPGGERDVRLRYDEQDQTFAIEIRDRESGELIQTFPPENLLNQPRRAADLLGTVIDRLS